VRCASVVDTGVAMSRRRESGAARERVWEAVGPTEKVMGGGGTQDRVPYTGPCVVEVAGSTEVP
jgi:hypothetical protein